MRQQSTADLVSLLVQRRVPRRQGATWKLLGSRPEAQKASRLTALYQKAGNVSFSKKEGSGDQARPGPGYSKHETRTKKHGYGRMGFSIPMRNLALAGVE